MADDEFMARMAEARALNKVQVENEAKHNAEQKVANTVELIALAKQAITAACASGNVAIIVTVPDIMFIGKSGGRGGRVLNVDEKAVISWAKQHKAIASYKITTDATPVFAFWWSDYAIRRLQDEAEP